MWCVVDTSSHGVNIVHFECELANDDPSEALRGGIGSAGDAALDDDGRLDSQLPRWSEMFVVVNGEAMLDLSLLQEYRHRVEMVRRSLLRRREQNLRAFTEHYQIRKEHY